MFWSIKVRVKINEMAGITNGYRISLHEPQYNSVIVWTRLATGGQDNANILTKQRLVVSVLIEKGLLCQFDYSRNKP